MIVRPDATRSAVLRAGTPPEAAEAARLGRRSVRPGRRKGLRRWRTIRALHKPEMGQDGGPVVKAAGRVMLKRDMGKLSFLTLRDETGDLKSPSTRSGSTSTPGKSTSLIDLGDQIVVEGPLGATKKGEITIWATQRRRCRRQGPAAAAGEVGRAGGRRAALPPALRRPLGQPRGDAHAEAAHADRRRDPPVHARPRLSRSRNADDAAPARRRRGAAVQDASQRARHPALPAHRAGAVPQAPARRRVHQGLRAQPQLPQRRHQPAAQPRVHDARGVRGVRHRGRRWRTWSRG